MTAEHDDICGRGIHCHVCGTIEHHYVDEGRRLWLWCGKCKHRWRWHSDTNPQLFKAVVAASHIRDVVSQFDDVTPTGWQDRAPRNPPAADPHKSVREQLVARPRIAPLMIDAEKPWQGAAARKPWQYRATAVIPHRNTPEHLELCLQFLEQQTERPYVMVIDTGSDDAALQRVLALRSESVEVHQVACHGTEDRVDAVCYAMDLALSACRTEYLWCVHSDCFVINRNLLAELLAKSEGGKHPVIGYESSSANPPKADLRRAECKGMVSHTCTLLHVPTMDRLDVSWSMRRLQIQLADAGREVVSDTEMALNYRLRDRGVTPLILGAEQVSGVERDANRVHLRSTTLTADVLKAMPGARDANEGALEELRSALARMQRDELESRALSVDMHRPRVSIIVTARNYGRFLRECLASCLNQSASSIEVIYSDDASTDDSVAVARSFSGVRTIQRAEHTGVCAARNRAVSASRGEVLIHVDGDDILPPDFVAEHLQAINADTPFVYGPAQAFGLHNTLWTVPSWGERTLWEMNFVNTSAAIWKKAFEAAGGWRENPTGTLWDWDLFLRAQRYGRPAPSLATLQYRQHAASWSHTYEDERDSQKRIKLLGQVRRARARLSIGCIYSGRLPELSPGWLDAICQSVTLAELPSPPELVILDNSRNQADAIYRETARCGDCFSSVRILPNPWSWSWISEIERRNQVATYMAYSSNRLLAETTGDLLWFVEDDVIVPDDGLRMLYQEITSGHPLKGAVAGAYQNRHTRQGWVSGSFQDDRATELLELPSSPLAVDITGTGCLLFWRALAPARFEPFLNGIPAHDWAFTFAMRKAGRDVLLLPDVRCRHHTTIKEWV